MNFFDQDLEFFPSGAQYYFNVLVRVVAINPIHAEEILGQGVTEICSIEHITDPRPYIICFLIDDEIDKDTEYEIECYPHCVVEVDQKTGVFWWDMLDFDTEDPWEIIPEEEDF